VFFALDSGTADSIVYDIPVEQTSSAADYQKWIGRVQAVESVTYIVTVPIVAAAVVALRSCREPRQHRAADRLSYRRQVTQRSGRSQSRLDPGVRSRAYQRWSRR
jgi:hypothetical protein